MLEIEVFLENLAEILKQIRLNSGVSQAEFAKKIGVSQRTWSAYEMGETRPKMATMLALSSMGYDVPGITRDFFQEKEKSIVPDDVLRES